MKKISKPLVLLLVLILVVSAFAGCQSKNSSQGTTNSESGKSSETNVAREPTNSRFPNRVDITAVYFDVTPESVPVQDSSVHDYKLKLEREYSNVYVKYEGKHFDTSVEQYLSMKYAAGEMPHIILSSDGYALKFLTAQNYYFDLNEEVLRKYMPNYIAFFEKYGLDLDTILTATEYEGWHYMLASTTVSNLPELANTEYGLQHSTAAKHNFYGLVFRDDVLKEIFPEARTEAELKELYFKQGYLTIDDVIGDIPIKNMEDLYEYLVKVKQLGWKVGDKPLIPAALWDNTEATGAIDFTLRTAFGLAWSWPIVYTEPPEPVYFPRLSPQFKEYAYWCNKIINAGLHEPEFFVFKNDQLNSKAANGEYAVMNWNLRSRTLPVVDDLGKERGYGWRAFPAFYPLPDDVLLNVMIGSDFIPFWGGVTVTGAVTEDIAEQVLAWLDWGYTQEYVDVTLWGLPEWYEGEGHDRRYKDEYKDIEEYMVYKSGNAGEKYGFGKSYDYMMNPNPGIDLYGPVWTYKVSGLYDKSRIDKDTFNIQPIVQNVVNQAWLENPSIRRHLRIGWGEQTFTDHPKMQEYENKRATLVPSTADHLIKLFFGPESEFEENWEAYIDHHKEAGYEEVLELFTEMWHEIYREKLLPNEY